MPTRIILMCPVFILLLRIKYLLKSKTDTTPAFLEPAVYGYQVYFKIPFKYTLDAEAHIIHLKYKSGPLFTKVKTKVPNYLQVLCGQAPPCLAFPLSSFPTTLRPSPP